MVRRSLVAAVVAVIAVLSFLLRPVAADVPAVLLVHGFDPSFAPAVDCKVMWQTEVDELKRQGRTRILTVGYYAGDTNCDIKLGSFDLNTPIEQIAKSLNSKAAAYGVVDLVGNSMGGLVVDYARAGGVAKEPGFVALRVRNMVLTGAPLHGAPLARLCFTTQCRQMVAGSGFQQHLQAIAPRPLIGTDETDISSVADFVVSWSSAQQYGAQHAVVYYAAAHWDFVRAGGATTWTAASRTGTGPWSLSYAQRSPARHLALALSSRGY